jgi:hypothetical protein
MRRYDRTGPSLAIFFFIFLTGPFVIPAASSAGRLATIPPQTSPTVSKYDGTITFKGDWAWKSRPETDPLQFVSPQTDNGPLVFQLTFSPSEKQGMHNVHGTLMARNGKYLTDYDATMLLEGVYMEDLGRLAAVAEPLHAVELPSGNTTTTSLSNNSTSIDTTSSSSSSDVTIKRGKRSEDIVAQSAALRKAAEMVLGLSESEAEAVLRAEEEKENAAAVGSNSSPGKNTTCRFSLELNFKRSENLAAAGTSTIKSKVDNSNDDGDGTIFSSFPLLPEDLQGTGTPSSSIAVTGELRALQCGFSIAITAAPADTAAYTAKATRYSMMMTLVGLIQIFFTVRQLEACSSTTAASRMSLLTLGQQGVQDAVLCLLHLTLAILVDPLFSSFATTACVQFCLFGIFELRMLLLTWRARRRGVVDPWTLHRELTSLYARFYGAVLASLVLCYNFRRYTHVLTFIIHGFWIPQIVKSAKSDTRPPLLSSYVIGISITRLVFPLYLFACPTNLLKIAPSVLMCVALVVLVASQAVVLLLQNLPGPRFGPRWFVPKKFLPAKYDYYRPCSTKRKGDIETGEEAEECVICMNPIDFENTGGAATMVAPCGHIFHSRCLTHWMGVKMQCPTCRAPLPPP